MRKDTSGFVFKPDIFGLRLNLLLLLLLLYFLIPTW